MAKDRVIGVYRRGLAGWTMYIDILCTIELWSRFGFNPALPLTEYVATLGLSKLGTVFKLLQLHTRIRDNA